MIRTSIYITVIGVLAFTLGYLYAVPHDELASFQQPRNVVAYSGPQPVDIPENYMQMSVDREHPDTLVGWFDVEADTVHLRFIVLNNLAAFSDDTLVNEDKCKDYDTSSTIGGSDSVRCDSPQGL